MWEPISPAPPVIRMRLFFISVSSAPFDLGDVLIRCASAGTAPARLRRSRTAATSASTTAPAPTMAPLPMVTPGRITAFVPMSAQAPMRTGLISRSVWMIGTSTGTPVCVDPSTLRARPPADEFLDAPRSRASK